MPAALASALAQHGTWPLARVIEPAIALAEHGFLIGEAEAGRWASAREELAKFGAGRGTYLKEDGTVWRAGDRVTNPLLARTLRRLATEGVASFYRGAIAAEIDRDMAAHGGFLLKERPRRLRRAAIHRRHRHVSRLPARVELPPGGRTRRDRGAANT